MTSHRFSRPMRLPVSVYSSITHQPLNACWILFFIEIAPEPPPVIIMCSLATTCSFCSVAGLDLFFTCSGSFRGGSIPSMRSCRGMTDFRNVGLYTADLGTSRAPSLQCTFLASHGAMGSRRLLLKFSLVGHSSRRSCRTCYCPIFQHIVVITLPRREAAS